MNGKVLEKDWLLLAEWIFFFYHSNGVNEQMLWQYGNYECSHLRNQWISTPSN